MSSSSTDTHYIDLSLSDAFLNKLNLWGRKAAFNKSLIPSRITLKELVAHISKGKAWAQGYFKSGRRKTAFISSQTLALDFDGGVSVADALADPFIRQYAFLIYPTPSSTPEVPRTRVIFILSEPVSQATAWETMQRGLINYFAHWHPDQSCKDATRMFYGSTVPGECVNYEARLPLEIAGGLTRPEAEAELQRITAVKDIPAYRRKKSRKSGKLSPQLVAEVERKLGVASARVSESGFIYEPIPCPIKQHEHDFERPAAYWHPEKKIVYCHKCHQFYLTHDIAKALNIDPGSYYPKETAGVVPCHIPYISDYNLESLLDKTGGLIIKSPTGSGKTEAIIKLILTRPGGRVLIIVHRKSLAKSLTKRLNEALANAESDLVFENYEGLTGNQLRQIPRLVICVNSLHKLVSAGQRITPYSLVVLDEIEQQLTHLIGDTFKNDEGVKAYYILGEIVRDARWAVAMDAYAGKTSQQWLQRWRGDHDVTMLVNTYRKDKGLLQVYTRFEDIIEMANLTLSFTDRPIVFAVSSIRLAKVLYTYFSGETVLDRDELERIPVGFGRTAADVLAASCYRDGMGLKRGAVAVVHGENSDTPEIQSLLENINERLPMLRVLIYTSAMGTGMDIQSPVAAVFCLFHADTLPADELHQMLGRCRNTDEQHVWIEKRHLPHEARTRLLYERELKAIETDGKLFNRRSQATWEANGAGVWELNRQQAAFLRFWCRIQARINRSLNHLRDDFLRLAKDEYEIVDRTDRFDDLEELQQQLADIQRLHKHIDKHLVLQATPVDRATFQRLRDRGDYTPQHVAGYIRWMIEQGYRQPITPTIYDHWEQDGLAQLRTFIEVTSSEQYALNQDMYQDYRGDGIPFRRHVTQRRQLIWGALQAVWGDFRLDDLEAVPVKHVDKSMGEYLGAHHSELWNVFRWDKRHDRKPKNVLNRLLHQIGLKLELVRPRNQPHQYRIHRESLAMMQEYAEVYLRSSTSTFYRDAA